VHQSLFDLKGENVFFDVDNQYKLSSVATSFIAGQMKHVKAVCAITAPTVNSYKRLVPGYEAPVYICWASKNRSSLIRIPRYSPGREKATRAELRCPDPSCNPYLAFAVMLKAGLDGIKNKMILPEPVEEDVYEFDEIKLNEKHIDTLPENLGKALEELRKNEIILEALGKHTSRVYLNAKKKEWDEYKIQVTEWEKKRYFHIL
ncbi:glutamine synthetase, partial [Candidatus Woesearchaeota archaeon]|nr:glutamine synthetase [Candidatus Woesearchaeota archaeon]